MDELRRKIVLSSPLLTLSLFGCGGGNEEAAAFDTGEGRARASATSGTNGQNLKMTPVPWYALDSIWSDSSGGGNYLVPSSTPSIHAMINGSKLYLSIVEEVAPSASVRIYKSLTMMLAVTSSGAPLAVESVYPVNGTSNTAEVRAIRRETANGGVTEQSYVYVPANAGTVKIASINGSTRKLTFSSVRFNPRSSPASRPFTISGDTTLQVPTETAAWV